VPAGMMMYMSDQPNDPHLGARGYILELDQPALGSILLEGPAFHATGLPAPITFPAPLFGEHTREICRSVLGYSDDTIDQLIAAGLLIEAPASPDQDLVKQGTHERTRDGGHHEG
jgi:benzylsuccinate CoA-transferase BbsF subunit